MKLFRKIKGKLGFTLAEMLIVVAILAILTAVAAPNVAKYSRGINLRELNDSARAIYMAAEHKFMNEIEMGNELPGLDDGAAKITEPLPRYDKTSEVDIFYLKSNDSGSPLKKLMSSGGTDVESTGVVESQLFDNNFIVEYNPKTGDVYGVFYSEKENFDDYTTNFYSDVADVQSKKLIGYYGSDNVKPEEKTNSKVLPKPEVEIINKEKLVVKINTESTENQYVTISVNGKEIIKRNNTYMNGSVEIILDSLTPGTPGKANLPSENGQLQPKYEDTIANWLDETGLTIDGSDMTLTVTFYDKDGKTRDQSVTKTFNPLFANGSTADTAYIEYGRHLQNLDKCSAITTAVIKKTINFASKAENYEGWANPDVYPGRKFVSLPASSINISARSGAEIQNIDIQGVDVYEDETLYAGLFTLFSGNATNLVFRNPKAESSSIVGIFCGYGMSAVVDTVTVINPKIECDNCAGGLIGMDGFSHIINCAVYVEEDDNYSWGDPNNDPYYHYTIVAENTDNYSGGLVGLTTLTTIKESYAAVKVSCEKGKAGGLVGFCSSETFIENSFSAGHTYYGIFEGNAKDGKEINLKDNVRGNIAGGIVSESQGDNEINIIGTVFSTCSVSGTTVDLAYNGTAVIKDGATVYTLGTAYLPDGTKTTKSSDERVKTGDEVKVDDSSAAVGKRYDLKVSSVYKYPLPTTGMTMHGDWPSSDAVTGFFYWEKHGEDYNFHILCDDCHEKEYENLCKKQDGSNITAYGYGAFSVGGSLDSAVTFCDGTDDVTIDEREEDAEKTVEAVTEAIQKALAGVDDLKITDLATVAVKLYDVTDVSGKTFVTATVSGNDYKFAPDFYAISADKGSDHAGTDADVFGVRSDSHLKNVKSYPAGIFEQSHDINYKDDTTGLTPIGDSTNKFTGTYDGGSYRIINAKINSIDTTDYAGLFGVTDGAQLENIVMFVEAAAADKFVEIKGKNVGVIVADARGTGTIENCVAAGYTVIGSENSGGIAGISACPITNCEANIKFGKVQNVAGGIVGDGTSAAIDSCYALIHGIESPKSSMTLGGIAGKASAVTNCYVIFSGQTVGYPVAKTGVDTSNYFVYDVGFCSIGDDSANSGTKVLLEENDDTEYPLLKSVKNAITGQISYSDKASPCDSTCQYEYAAVVDDKVAGHLVHYGPFPEASSGELITGPIAGIYHLKEYLYNSEMTHSGQFDGYLGYNKNGVLFFSEADLTHSTYPQEYIGVFLEKTYEGKELSINDPRIEIKIDGKIIDKSKIKKFEEYYNLTGKWILAYYPFFSKHNIQDHFTQMGTDVVEDVQDKFNFYVLFEDDGSPIDYSSKTIIQILFKPDGKPKGVLIEGYKNHGTTKNNLRFAGSLPTSGYDEDNTPRVGALLAQRRENNEENSTVLETYDSSKPYYIKATIGNTNLGGEGGWDQDYSRIGILIHKDDVAEYESGRLKIALDKVFVELKPWNEVTNYAAFANKNILDGYEDYRLFVVDEDRAYGHPMLKEDGTIIRNEKGQIIFNNVTNLPWTLDFIYGTKKFLAYENNGGFNPQEFTESLEYVKLKD